MSYKNIYSALLNIITFNRFYNNYYNLQTRVRMSNNNSKFINK